jgi:hypothetical protein
MKDDQTRLADPPESLNDYERGLINDIRHHGWRTLSVGAAENEPPFSYTTGFIYSVAQPEIIVFDFPGALAHDVFGTLYERLRGGRHFPMGEPVDGVLSGEHIYLLPVRQAAVANYLLSAKWFYKGSDVACVQLVWADGEGRFPWQDGFDSTLAALQPDLSCGRWGGLGA